MKKKLIWEDELEEVDLGDEDYVTIAKTLTIKDMAAVGVRENQIDMSLALLRQCIKSWRGPSFERDGEVAEITEDTIGRLDMGTANILAAKITSSIVGDRMDDEERKESTEISSPISTTP